MHHRYSANKKIGYNQETSNTRYISPRSRAKSEESGGTINAMRERGGGRVS